MIQDLDAVGIRDVSRETLLRLNGYIALLKKWNRTINLISQSTIPDLWRRHFLDSAQVCGEIPQEAEVLVDLGSGAGFPGLVISILAVDSHPKLETICLESDRRKAAFLNAVIRDLGLSARVIPDRIENVERLQADVATARALAPVRTLLEYSSRHLKPGGRAVFLKGAGFPGEVEEARKKWAFDIRAVPSKTDQEGAVLVFGDIRRE